jgi:small subunit ribosomal protein S21
VALTCAATLCASHIAVHQAARFLPGNKLTTVILKPDEPVEVALRRFRRAIESTGLIPELLARTAYEKPTAERKRQKAAAVARLRKQIKRSLPPKKQA